MKVRKENLFVVIKTEDLQDYFENNTVQFLSNLTDKECFMKILDRIKHIRHMKKKKENSYIVVNQDEPYAEEVWQLILKRESEKIQKRFNER